jgi:hypothetical protein
MNGVLQESFPDYIKGGYVHRISNTHLTVYNNNNLALYSQKKLKLVSIKDWKKRTGFVTKPNIGVIDTETYCGSDNVSRIYAIGFKTDLDKKAITYYLDAKTKSSEEIVITALHEMMRPKYGNIKYYCHNFGGYDAFYIIPVIYNYNDKHPENPFILNYVFRDQRIIKWTISKRFEVEEKDKVKIENEDKMKNVNTTLRKIDIMDSYCIFPISQYDLCKIFETNLVKGVFPHRFAGDSTLFYRGSTPDIKYYDNKLDNYSYNLLCSDNWDFKEECIKYLRLDLDSLLEVLIKANKKIFRDYGVNMVDSTTISGLALNLFMRKFYKKNLPSIGQKSIYKDIKNAYYGGVTEVYKPYGENLFYYDVNSLYPYAALQTMPGILAHKLEYSNFNPDINDLFGFFYCDVYTPKSGYLGLLPFRSRRNGLIYPLGNYTGW